MTDAFSVDISVLESAPARWDRRPLWTLIRRRDVTDRPDAELLSVYRDHGIVPKDSRDDNFNKPSEDLSNYRYVRPGDLVLNKMKTWQGSLGVSQYEGIVSPAYYVCVLSPDVDPRFAHHLLRSTPYIHLYRAASTGIRPNQWDLPYDEFQRLPMLLPPLDEQRRIADFLDAETARIDGLRAKRLAQVSVLEELELARIGAHLSAATLTGPVYAYFDVQLGKMLNPERAAGDNQQPYLRHANIHWYEISTDDVATMTFEPEERLRYGLQTGDLLVNEGGAGGTAEAAVWDGRIPVCFYQKSLHRVRTRSHVPVEWLMYWLRYAKAIGVFEADNNKATIPHLTGEKLSGSRIPIPEYGHRVVTELAAEIAAIRETQRKMELANVVLAERRQALITAAVTGGITV